ncbi:PQQ-dependent sugar dehydrogenase [Paracoccus sp. (in: a-proteobacteria)]|uniref:PQQ-dependent sugar dehydrogenase n=1 Tax=Paracoccus sp. TaxID=267 RepID=UPI00396CAC80
MQLSPLSTLALGALITTSGPALAQNSPGSGPVATETVLYEPTAQEPTPERIEALNMPDGFHIEVFAKDLGNTRMLVVSDSGNVYVTRRDEGDLLMLGNADGEATEPQTVLERENLHGIHIDGDRIYLATINEVLSAPLSEDGTVGELETIADDIPDAGQHPNRTLAIGPDGALYLSVGSTCNACDEPKDEHATILRIPLDGGERSIHAEGLRNTIGFGWHPVTEEMWGVDHGSDARGTDTPPEELNRITQGSHYGWPWCHGDRQVDRFVAGLPTGFDSKDAFCETTEAPVATYVPHSAPLQMAFYTGNAFPEEYRDDAFQVMRGSWNANPPAGYEVVRINFEDGEPTGFEPFITGFLTQDGDGHGQIARLAGLAVTPEGALLIADDHNGVIYRIRHAAE